MIVAPLLNALGWDAMRGEIVPEYVVGNGRADYALFKSPKQIAQPLAFIEVKRMGIPLTDEHFDQVMRYAEGRKSVSYAVLTNGDEWELYNLHQGELSQVFAVSLRRQSARKCAEALRALTRPVLVDGESRILSPKRGAPAQPKGPRVRMFIWFFLATVIGILLGAIPGFRVAQPVFEPFAGTLGAIATGLGVFVAFAFVARRLPVRALWNTWLAPATETGRGMAAAAVVGLLVGGLIGYLVGLQVAQAVYDLLALIGWAMILAIVAAIMIAIAKQQPRRRRRRPSRRYPRRWRN